MTFGSCLFLIAIGLLSLILVTPGCQFVCFRAFHMDFVNLVPLFSVSMKFVRNVFGA